MKQLIALIVATGVFGFAPAAAEAAGALVRSYWR